MSRRKNEYVYPKETISITIPYGYKAALAQIAGKKGTTTSSLITEYIKKENPDIREIFPDGRREEGRDESN